MKDFSLMFFLFLVNMRMFNTVLAVNLKFFSQSIDLLIIFLLNLKIY